MKYTLLFVHLLSIGSWVCAQEVDESCTPPDKKVIKVLDRAKEELDPKLATDLFTNAMNSAPDKAAPYFEFAMYAYKKADEYYGKGNDANGDKSLQRAEKLFLQVLDLCEEYHADVYYNLGVIAFTFERKEQAGKWFEKFANFKVDNPNAYAGDHRKKLADVNKFLAAPIADTPKAPLIATVPYNPVLVPKVSTPAEEYVPMLSPDNELLFFTRMVDDRGKGELQSNWVEKFTVANRATIFDQFDGGTYLKRPFNDGRFESYGASTLSVDNKELIFCACKTENVRGQDYKNCDLYSTTYERTGKGVNDFRWTEFKNLGHNINTEDGWEGQPSLSADGNTLYFTTTRKGSRDNDIYYSTRKPGGEWGIAKPLNELNTAGKDKSPFLHQDSETMYFVSDSRNGVGGLDIYYTRKENGKWSEPKNIGIPINTPSDEVGIFVSIDGTQAYFSSREGGDWNIYSFELYEEARPKPVSIIKGELVDAYGEPVEDAIIEVAYKNSEETEQIKVNGNDGRYAAIVRKDQDDVMITVKKQGHAFDSKLVTQDELNRSKDVAIRGTDLNVRKLEVGESYTLNDILFATNSSVLTERSKFIIKGFGRFLAENPTITILIEGHTDNVGDDAKNLKLSDDRAQVVKNYLISLGIDQKRLKAKGYGATRPKVVNDSESNRALNRRTDFVIQSL